MMSLSFGKIDYWGDCIPHRPAELSYIKQIPLPIENVPRKTRIEARCIDRMTILQAALPTRKQVRECNYIRRTDQIRNQGFSSLNEQPYRAIGHPVYLDNRKLITDSLGLLAQESDDEQDKPSTPSSSINNGQGEQSAYMMRRSKKQLNTLRKEIERGRNLLRNVKLGHGLFKVLQDEWTKTISKRELDEALEKQKAMMNWQLANTGSDSDSDSDDDLENEHDLTKEFVHIDVPHYGEDVETTVEDTDHVRFTLRPETHIGQTHPTNELSTSRDDAIRQKPASALPLRRRKANTPRPFTPVHSNISQKKQSSVQIIGETLFRQLCCLHWILKTMDISEIGTMSPIITCWELNADKMGGIELNKKIVEDKKQREQQKYDNLFKVPKQKEIHRIKPKAEKKRSIFFPSRLSRSGSIAHSMRSRSGSISHSQTSEVMTPMNDIAADDPRLEQDNSTITEERYSLESSHNAMLASSGFPQAAAVPEAEPIANSRPQTRQPSTGIKQPLTQLTREELKHQELAKQLEEVAKMDSMPMERLSHSRMYRATANMKPKSSKELAEFKTCCKSSKLVNKSKDLRQSWAEVKEERALRLHDELDYQEKNRLRTCQDKFSAMKTSENSFHRALKNMRLQSEHMRKESEKEKNKKQDQSKYAKWFDDLINMVPKECASQWYFKAILDKLRTFGIKYGPDNKTESSSKASEHKFTRVLKFIRSWEICSPNVAAAVEFCRDRIIEMNEEDFEELFQHLFPAIERPKTAPAKSSRPT